MLRLVTTSDKIQAVLAGAVTTNELQIVACYSDKTASAYTGGANRVNTNGTTDVDVVGAPGSSTVRDVDLINVYQRDTASATVTLKIDVSGTEHILGKWTLAAGDVLTYTHGHAWQVIDSTGQLKGSGTGGGGGAVDSVNGQTGTVVLDADDIDDATTTNKFVTAADITKLGNLSGTNSGDVSLAGTPDYITISGQTITRGQVDLTTDVTGDLPFANLVPATATSRVVARKTASGGDWEECTLSELLDFIGSAAQGDILYRGESGWSRLGAGTSGYYLKTQGAGADPTWAAVSGGSGGSVGTFPGGRLTTESGVGVSTSDRTSQSTLYYTPYISDYIRLYNGSSVAEYAFTERSLALSGLTSGKNYDVFLYDNSGTLTLELTAWTSDTARATALAWQTGLGWVKSGTATRLYLGTIRTTSTTTTEDSGGGSTSQVGGKRFVWNCYNSVCRILMVKDTTDSWTYGTDSYRQSNAASGNKVEYVAGISLTPVIATARGAGAGSGVAGCVGVGIDSTSSNSAMTYDQIESTSAATKAEYQGYPGIGYHYVAWLERTRVGTITWYGDAGVTSIQTGLFAKVWT